MYYLYVLSLLDKTTLPSYSRWKIRWSGCSPKLSALESEPLLSLAPQPNLVITAYFDYTKHLFLTPRYDAQLQSLGLAPFFSSSHASSSIWRRRDACVCAASHGQPPGARSR